MPYIKQKRREELDKDSQLGMIGLGCESEGELNYVLTMICKGYLSKLGTIKYARLNAIIGALECCKLEFYRRTVAEYENIKIKESGDVYE